MGREERQALLHEGSGSAVVSAYVEVIFDNTDERFPTGKDELILRRTIGLKKDEYSLDRKNATKADVMNLLESAGFSRSNPYYIVPQGRVTTLTNMKDSERLSLLKEVAGTQVYEARRLESLKIMTDTVNKRKKIDELLDYIKERLAELEEEKEDLRGFQEKDRERRCLEYTIYHREQVEIANALDGIDGMRQTGVDDTDGSREKFLRGEKDIQAIEREIQSLRQQVDFLKVDKQQLEEERRENAKARAKVELDVTALSEGQSQSTRAKSQHDNELKAVQAKISQRERELQTIRPQFDAKREQEVAIRTRLEDADALRHRLYAKQGRSARFKTQNERDNWLRKEISDANVALATRKAIRMQTTEEIAGLQEEIQTMTARIEELRGKFDNRGDSMSNIAEEVQAIKDKRDALMDERKELWREEAKLDSVIETARQELERAERVLSHTMDQNTSRGLDAVRRIAKQQKLEGVYGTLAEVIDVNERYRTAVEVAAGQSLFHYVVDNDETATKVLEILQKERAGRVTFMPLNRLKPRPINVPKTGDAVPMLEKIKFDEKYQKAVEQVFGKTIICPNLQVAAQYARSHGVSAITPDGDRSDKKGALTGGYHDPRKSRLEAFRSVAKWRTEYEDLKEKTRGVRKGVEKKDQEITREVGELQKVEQRKQRVEGSYGPLRNELRASVSLLEKYRDDLEAKIRAKDNVEASLKLLEEQLSAFEAELASDLQKMLSKDEERQLEQLSASAQDFRRQYAELSSSRSELEVQKSMIEVELRENLRQRLDQLKNQEFENLEEGSGSASHRLRESQRELKRIGQTVATIQKKLQETEEAMENTNRKLTELEQGRSEKYQDQEDVAQSIERQQKKMEKSMAKKALLTEKAAECSRNIRDLGVLPEEAFDRFEKMASNNVCVPSSSHYELHLANPLCHRSSSVSTLSLRRSSNTPTSTKKPLSNMPTSPSSATHSTSAGASWTCPNLRSKS